MNLPMCLAAGLAAALTLTRPLPVGAAEIKVLTAGAFKQVVLAPAA